MKLAPGFADILREQHNGDMSREEASALFASLIECEAMHLRTEEYRAERITRPRLTLATA